MRIFLFSGLDKEKFVIIIERWEKKRNEKIDYKTKSCCRSEERR